MLTVYLKENCLLIDNPIFDAAGLLVYGEVVNGDWQYRCNGIRGFAYHSKENNLLNPVNTWEYALPTLVFVPRSKRGRWYEYGEAIDWAEKQPAFEGSLQDHLDMASLESVNIKPRTCGFDDMDDDIAF